MSALPERSTHQEATLDTPAELARSVKDFVAHGTTTKNIKHRAIGLGDIGLGLCFIRMDLIIQSMFNPEPKILRGCVKYIF